MPLKRVHPSILMRVNHGKAAGIAAFLSSAGLLSTVYSFVSITGQVVAGWLVGVSAGICVVIGLVTAYIRGRLALFSDTFVDELSADGHYTCSFLTSHRLKEAVDLTRPYYGDAFVAYATALQWWNKDPKGFTQLLNEHGDLCACVGVLALSEDFMDKFIAGTVTEDDLTPAVIRTFEESRQSESLYISGVIVRDPSTFKGSKRARVMIWTILKYLKDLYGLARPRTIYGLAVTKESDRLMRGLGFKLVCDATVRRDHHSLYAYVLTRESWAEMMKRVGDFSGMCTCDFRRTIASATEH